MHRPIHARLLLPLLVAAPALAGPSDLPSYQFLYAPPAGDLVYSVAIAPGAVLRAGGPGAPAVRTFSFDGDALGSFATGADPLDVAVAADGTVWASFPSRDDLRAYTAGGSGLVALPGVSGALATAPGGEVFVATTTSVRRFAADGSPGGEWPFCPTPHGCIGVALRGIAVGPDTTVYVSIDENGGHFVRWLHPSGGSGTLPWPWATRAPRGLALDAASGELFVAFFGLGGGGDGVVKYSAVRDTVGTAWMPAGASVLGGIAVDPAGHLHVPTSLGVARFGLGTDPVRRTSWGALKRAAGR